MEGLGSLLLFALSFYLMMRFGCGAHMTHGHGGHSDHSTSPSVGSAKDPVCGMNVAEGEGYVRMHEGRPIRFCSRSCLDKFELNPANYAATVGAAK